ncbi:MAG: glycerol-3-phosphate dehydrogenase/oxidase [Thermoanaerobaculia bacterium]
MFHKDWRQLAIQQLDAPFDLVIVGGGITGCGIFLDAAQRGLRVLMIEKQDIASGTSSRSSKLVHGGLRYLKQMQFRVTRTACRERDRMLSLNPLLVQPIRFLYPAHKGDKIPGWKVDLGLWMYDRLTRLPEKHSHVSLEEFQRLAPGIDTTDLEMTLAYTDAMTDDARLTLAVAATGFAYGGLMLTRAEVAAPLRAPNGTLKGVVVRDLESGKSYRIESHLVVNAAGVWVDRIRQLFDMEGARLRPSRGSHIVLPHHRLPIKAAMMIPSPDDQRPVFLIPHPKGVLVGTTDIYHDGSLADPRPTQDELSYLIRALQSQFPLAALSLGDIVAAFAGLRPILDAHTDNPSAASREEEIWEERGLLCVAGGKLTTWRPTAEEAVDEALTFIPEERAQVAAPCSTKGTALVGLAPADLADRLERSLKLDAEIANGAARRLRASAWRLSEVAHSRAELDPLIEGSDLCAAEVRAHLTGGAVLHLEDLLLRRARLGLWQPDLAVAVLPQLRPIFREEMGWDNARWSREEASFDAALEAWSPRGVTQQSSPN